MTLPTRTLMRQMANQTLHRYKIKSAAAAAAPLSTLVSHGSDKSDRNWMLKWIIFSSAMMGPLAYASSARENATSEKFTKLEADVMELKEFRMEEVKQNDGKDGKPIWVTYGGNVYDITDFVANHPGGSEKIILAAGGPVEPWWNLYRQHFSTDLPMVLMEKMLIGRLAEADQESVDEYMEKLLEIDPYAFEPDRDPDLRVHSATPMNAESPYEKLLDSYLTPNELFYIRHHHPVPLFSEEQLKAYRLRVDLSEVGIGVVEFSLDELKSLPKHEVVATLQCSGNRRGAYNEIKRTSGTSWYQGAISTAKWGGVKLRDLLEAAGLKEEKAIEEGFEHVRFHSIDGMKASIDLAKAMSLYGDCLVAYEMNDKPLPRDHGFPVRAVVPGYVGVRNVKWIDEIKVSSAEADSPFQRGLNYKILPPSVTDVKSVDLTKIPAMQEASLFSGITKIETVSEPDQNGEVILSASGWAWAGGGRNIVRVDISADGGKSWNTSEIYCGGDQKFNRAWAWIFWRTKLRALIAADGTVELCSKAVDGSYNIQPLNPDWNVRGLGNNSWFRKSIKIESKIQDESTVGSNKQNETS